MEPKDSASNGSSKINIVDTLPSPDYKPTVNLAMLQIVIKGKVVSAVIIQRYVSAVAGQEPVWKPLPMVIAQQTPQSKLWMPGGASRN
jgi:hypothetical protein